MPANFRIVYIEDGYPRELIGEADWTRAIATGALTPETEVTIYGAGEAPQACEAGTIPALRSAFGFDDEAPILLPEAQSFRRPGENPAAHPAAPPPAPRPSPRLDPPRTAWTRPAAPAAAPPHAAPPGPLSPARPGSGTPAAQGSKGNAGLWIGLVAAGFLALLFIIGFAN